MTTQCGPRWPELSPGVWLLSLQRGLWPPAMTSSVSLTLAVTMPGRVGETSADTETGAAPAQSQTLFPHRSSASIPIRDSSRDHSLVL